MKNPLSIYVHWPFCLSKCPYCDFNSHVAESYDHFAFEKAYIKELASNAGVIADRYIKSIFFGGGTPSLMNPKVVYGIIKKINSLGIIDDKTEITLEANPTSIEYRKFEDFRRAGINRISVGIQALNDKDLKALGRNHSAKESIEAIEIAKQVFDNYSFDLIYAREGQGLKEWQDELPMAMELAGNHISLYQLVIEKATKFYKLHSEGKMMLPSSDFAADLYEYSLEFMRSKGFDRYEISNYAKPGFECKHNLTYWHYEDYFGIGPGAHSRLRYDGEVISVMNHHRPDSWLENINRIGYGSQNKLTLTEQEVLEEFLMMNLRLEKGCDRKKVEDFLGKNLENMLNNDELKKFVDNGMIKLNENNISLTDSGLMMHSYIIPRLCS